MGNGTTEHIALFIDLENFFGYCNGLGLPIDLAPELEKLTELGKVTFRHSFGDIQKLPIPGDRKQEIRKMLQQNLIRHEDVPYHNAFKNSADIRLVIEALSLVFSNKDIDLVAVVGCDRDYLPLFSKLRELGKEVVGIGGSKDNTPDIYVRACDYFYYHEALTGKGIDTTYGIPETLTTTTSTPEEGIALLIEALQVLSARGDSTLTGASVMTMMRRLRPDFDLADYGFQTFKDLCRAASDTGAITISHLGAKFDLRLVDQPASGEGNLEAEQAVGEPAPPPAPELKTWVEDKMKIQIPGHGSRILIYKHLHGMLDETPSIALASLAEAVAEKTSKKDVDQNTAFKILYSLYRANCFACSPGATPFNPVIDGCRIEREDLRSLDKALIQNTMRLFLKEHKAGSIDAEQWSSLFFRSGDYVEWLKEVAQGL